MWSTVWSGGSDSVPACLTKKREKTIIGAYTTFRPVLEMRGTVSLRVPWEGDMIRDMKKGKKWILIPAFLLAVLLLIAGAAWLGFHHYTSKLNYVALEDTAPVIVTAEPEETPPVSEEERAQMEEADRKLQANLETPAEAPENGPEVMNILLIGVDNHLQSTMDMLGNADGQVILSINRNTKEIVMTSIMRDLYVSIPNAHNTKITYAYHVGGTATLIDTIKANLGVSIDNYILVNYINVTDIVDALGGVDLELSSSEIYYMRGKIDNICRLLSLNPADYYIRENQTGMYHLNGVQTAAYLRVRSAEINGVNNDYGRTERARKVLSLLMDKARGMKLSELNAMADKVLPCITTDLSQSQLLELVVKVPQYLKYNVVSQRIPVDGSFYGANFYGSVLVMDPDVNRRFLQQSIYEGIHEAP